MMASLCAPASSKCKKGRKEIANGHLVSMCEFVTKSELSRNCDILLITSFCLTINSLNSHYQVKDNLALHYKRNVFAHGFVMWRVSLNMG